MIAIKKLTKANKQTVLDLNALLKQLRKNPAEHSGSLSDLRTIVNDKNAALIVAQDGKKIVGMATIYVFTKLGKKIATIEDVVVDDAYRGQGLGKKIMQKIISTARAKKVKTLQLTSRPSRVAANKLYQKLGFELKKTNPYTMKLPKRS